MIKTLSQALRMDKERFKVPKSVQQAIPIQRIWPDGIFQQGTKFSKTYASWNAGYLRQYFQQGNSELERRKNDMDICR